ncbi:MAG: hypothetical protein ABIO99_07255 [Candidatus Limnocylindria bacterium]
MLGCVAIALIAFGAILIVSIPLFGWWLGGMLVFIGVSLYFTGQGARFDEEVPAGVS